MSAFVYQSEGHRYLLDGVEIPSVTTVIRAAGLMPPMFGATDWHLQRGTAVHKATALSDENDLDETTVDPEIRGRLDAWRAFRAATPQFVIAEIERPRYHPGLRYGGTADREGSWAGRPSIVDIKGGAPAAWHGVQLSAYAALVGAVDRYGVYLAADGTWKVVPYTDRQDVGIFQSALACYQWRDRHGLLERA